MSENGVIHNANIYGIDLSKIDGLILSHGHFDHFTGLVNIIKRISYSRQASANNIDVFTHLDAFLRRWAIFPDGKRAKFQILLRWISGMISSLAMQDVSQVCYV